MSKSSKARKAAKRKADKNRKKLAATAQYAAWRDAGVNSKSKRAQRNQSSSRLVRMARVRVRTRNYATFAYYTDTFGVIGKKLQRQNPFLYKGLISNPRTNEIDKFVVTCTQRQYKNQVTFKQFQKLMKQNKL